MTLENVIPFKELPDIEYDKEEETKSGPGRPKVEIDKEQLVKLAKLGANNTEIADFFNCSESVIRKRFSDVLKQSRAHLKMRLRQSMLDNAFNKGNVVAQIWLSKNILGFSEQGPRDEQEEENKVLPWQDD